MVLQISEQQGVVELKIQRPKKGNSLSREVVSALRDALRSFQDDSAVIALVVTGEGSRFFCAGGDLSEFESASYSEQLNSKRDYMDLLKDLRSFPKPTIAKVNGSVRGGGIGLVLACDLVFASDEASFATPEIKVGLFPMMVSALLFRELPKTIAFDMVYTGRILDANEAYELNLVYSVVNSAVINNTVDEYCQSLAKLSPLVLKLGKTAIAATRDQSFLMAVETMNAYLSINLQSSDAREGLAAFLQKREPKWTGE